MRTGVHILRGYKDGDNQFIDDLKAVIAPVTIVGKEYVAVVKSDGAWILRVNIGDGTYFEEDKIFTSMISGSIIFIGLILLQEDNVQNSVSQLIHEYWEKTRMESDKEAAIMYSTAEKEGMGSC